MPAIEPPADLNAVLGELRSIKELLAREPSQLLSHDQAAVFCGVSRSAWFRLLSSDSTPKAVDVPGVGPRFRRGDLMRWVERLKSRRRSPKVVPVVEGVEVLPG